MEVNLGARLFRNIQNVFRLRRIHRQAGASEFKESLLRLRDAAHTKEDVALWKTHDVTSPECKLSPEQIRVFQRDRVHLSISSVRSSALAHSTAAVWVKMPQQQEAQAYYEFGRLNPILWSSVIPVIPSVA